ncbi:MAG: tetratricopeptide repeat protein [Okeania sp. SIO3I5]|uniref:tetratricopeptide repeat protein n=1 Tax=Okeania sp. SIO3I5 TaxID=2607805 RepID=UPI0013BCEC82|nr:tetratricopeptide repeat protein [Okeania sp. SIO3I5]NEQ39182.1 tetratricopeptide repeat protein [Okeania sp. SIO3I5]
MSENTGDKVDVNKNYVGTGIGVNKGNIINSTFANTINYLDTGTKGLPRKGEPANFPNNLNKLRTGAVKFVGRDGDLKTLHDQLQEKERVSITEVKGMAGVGKTELALQYALLSKRELTYPGGICWIGVRERSVLEQLLKFARIQLGLFPPEDWNLEDQLEYCWSNWQPAGDVLIILDDVDKYEEIKRYLPPQEKRFKSLITTRRYSLSASFENLRLEVLDEGSALELLEALIGESRVAEQREEAKQLCQWLGYLPLGLELVGSFLKVQRSGWKLARMIQELEKLALDSSALEKPWGEMTAERGVKAALELSWRELDEGARYLGCFLSMFALAPIPWSLVEQCLSGGESQEEEITQKWFPTFSQLWSSLVPQRKANVLELRTLEDVREDSLLGLNLIQQTVEETFQLHQLVRLYFRDKLNKMKKAEQLRYQFCRGMVVEAKKVPQTSVKADIEKLSLSIPHLTETATEMRSWVEDKDLTLPFTALARFYEGQGLYGLAEPWSQQCLDITRIRSGVEHLHEVPETPVKAEIEEVALSIEMQKWLGNLTSRFSGFARLYEGQGLYELAESWGQQCSNITRVRSGVEHLRHLHDVASSLNSLAILYSKQGRYTEAEPLFLEALEMKKRLLGKEHPDVANSLNDLATLYYFQGRYTEAEPLFLEALEMKKRLLGKEHPDVANSLNNLAALYSDQGRHTEAEPLFLQALEMTKRLLGTEHPDVANSLNNLALLYSEQGRYKEAEPLLLEALKMKKQLLGAEHLDVAMSLHNLAKLYYSQGRYKEAEPLLLEALKMKKRLLGYSHPDVAMSLNNLALLYYYQGRYTEAKLLYLEALEMGKELLGAEHPNTQTFLKNYLYFLQQVLRENRQEDLSDERSLQIISEMEKSSLENS